MTTGLFWFTNDLRAHDQPALWQMQSVDRLVCVFCIDPQWFRPNGLNTRAMGARRRQFLMESLQDLNRQLSEMGQILLICEESPPVALAELMVRYKVDVVGRSNHAGVYENRHWQLLKDRFPDRQFVTTDSHTLFAAEDLPFPLEQLPPTFSEFRRLVEPLAVPRPLAAPWHLPPPPGPVPVNVPKSTELQVNMEFRGGETAALRQLDSYFSSTAPASYKLTRNALDGWQNSTKFSALASAGLPVSETADRETKGL